jgi:transcriptional regulator with XRE-family HTH domain
MVGKNKREQTAGKTDENRVKYPDFAARLREAAKLAGLSQADVQNATGWQKETVRLYFKGSRMPDDERMRILAKLLGRDLAHLRFGANDKTVQPPAEVIHDDDEMSLLAAYRRLPPFGKKALRARAAELLENFAPPDPGNPFGKKARGTQ